MRVSLASVVILCLVDLAAAADLGNHAPIKPATQYTVPPADPNLQGGDTIFTAFPIVTIQPQFHDTGTTVGYTNDYDEICPYSGSTSPDVVYSYVAEAGVTTVTVDLCYSSYDTKVYMYDASIDLIACNDDFYFAAPCYTYSSKIEDVHVTAGETYYIVVDGYGGASGAYDIVVAPGEPPCVFECPINIPDEGEPPLYNGYVDHFNGGCNTQPDHPFEHIYATGYFETALCGTSGWYLSAGGSQYRDTDWYTMYMGYSGTIDVTVDAEQPTYIFELGPQDCSSVAVIQSAIGGPCNPGYMTITGYGIYETVWFWAGPTTFTPPSGENPESYKYTCWFHGLYDIIDAVETRSWGAVKALYE